MAGGRQWRWALVPCAGCTSLAAKDCRTVSMRLLTPGRQRLPLAASSFREVAMSKRGQQICTKCRSVSNGRKRGSILLSSLLWAVGILSLRFSGIPVDNTGLNYGPVFRILSLVTVAPAALILLAAPMIYTGWRWRGGYSNCPKCHGENTMVPLSTPTGQELAQRQSPQAASSTGLGGESDI